MLLEGTPRGADLPRLRKELLRVSVTVFVAGLILKGAALAFLWDASGNNNKNWCLRCDKYHCMLRTVASLAGTVYRGST